EISLEPENFFPTDSRSYTQTNQAQFSKACAFIAKTFLNLCFFCSSITVPTELGKSSGKPQARHIPPVPLHINHQKK
uniref:Uncharacterized protein n=1 Tax=Malurus cyaneus samueli TaxID=2593467 RepID=A0A8C5T4C0_9PASS